MKINIIFFGQLTDITGTEAITMDGVIDTDGLVRTLEMDFPALTGATYIIAVNKEVIYENTLVADHSTIALLPPFSGG